MRIADLVVGEHYCYGIGKYGNRTEVEFVGETIYRGRKHASVRRISGEATPWAANPVHIRSTWVEYEETLARNKEKRAEREARRAEVEEIANSLEGSLKALLGDTVRARCWNAAVDVQLSSAQATALDEYLRGSSWREES